MICSRALRTLERGGWSLWRKRRSSCCNVIFRLANETRNKINELERLKINPYSAPPLKGKLSFLRSHHTNFRGVAYRIIFEISESAKEVLIHIVASRGAVYKLLDRLFR